MMVQLREAVLNLFVFERNSFEVLSPTKGLNTTKLDGTHSSNPVKQVSMSRERIPNGTIIPLEAFEKILVLYIAMAEKHF